MQVFGMSDVGMKRELNEDNFSADIYDGMALALVCDGMGGANAGEVASRIACRTFKSKLVPMIREIDAGVADRTERCVKIERAVYEACDAANREVYSAAKSNSKLSGMGTTLSGCLTDGETVWTFNVGDSRVYRITDGGIKQLTVDHSFVQALLDDGKITEEEALSHPNRNVILRALGISGSVDCDIDRSDAEEGYYLVCSDGMSNYFDEDEFSRIILSGATLEQKVRRLVGYANSRGGSDNITAVLMDIQNEDHGGNNEQ